VGLVFCLSGFAAAYAGLMYFGSWIGVTALGWRDPKFGNAAGNLQMVGEILPMVVAITTLSAFFGARQYQEWLRRRAGIALAAGSGAGALTAVAFFAFAAVFEIGPEMLSTGLLSALRILILAVPAMVAYAFIGFMRRNASGDAV
jgi:hypothetical protein